MKTAAALIIAAGLIACTLLYTSPRPVTVEQVAMQVSETTECAFIVTSAGGVEAMVCAAAGQLDISRARWIGGAR